jgi:hypothetical protein
MKPGDWLMIVYGSTGAHITPFAVSVVVHGSRRAAASSAESHLKTSPASLIAIAEVAATATVEQFPVVWR